MNSEAVPARQRYTLVVRNLRSTGVTLILEPQGLDFTMPPGAAFEVRAEGPAGDALEVDFVSNSIVLWGWTGSVIRIYNDGVELKPALFGPPPPVPATPEGMSVRDFVHRVLGEP